MSPNLRVGQKTLSYPLWAVDFDPQNPDFLLVGGGGGATSSGVPNKITLLDVSRAGTINEIVDLDLAKDEDSVTSLAVADSDAQSLTAYAGINSSVSDQEKGKNEHFRSFKIGLPVRKRTADGEEKQSEIKKATTVRSQALTRAALFRFAAGKAGDAYQRKLRVATTIQDAGTRVGAIASGLAPQNEVITFKATSTPGSSSVISRINLESNEAADLDIIAVGDDKKSSVLAYCTDYEVFVQLIPGNGKNIKEPNKVSTSTKSAQSGKIKCVRWINSRYLVVLKNRPEFTGSHLEILKTDKDYTQAQVVRVRSLNKKTKSAVGLDTCALSANPDGERQFIIGVVGQDCSIEILAVDYTPYGGLSKIKQFTRLREVQPGPITGIKFSTFIPPSLPTSKDTRPQFIRMASVSATNVVVVNTIPLRPYPGNSKNPRYLVVPPPETVQNAINIIIALLVVGVTAFCMQVFCEIRGALPPFLNAQDWLSPAWQQRIARPYIIINKGGPVIPESMPPSIVKTATEPVSSIIDKATESIKSAAAAEAEAAADSSDDSDNPTGHLQTLMDSGAVDDHTVILRDDANNPDTEHDISLELHGAHADISEENAKKWDDLTHTEKRGWKKKLKDAGHWTEQEGEKILKGIMFGELAGVVGAALG